MTSLVFILIGLVVIIAVLSVVVTTQILAHAKNETRWLRKRHDSMRESSVLLATAVVLLTYIITISASGIYRDAEYYVGFILAAIGMLVVALTYVVSHILSVAIWNKAHHERIAQKRAIRRLEEDRDSYRAQTLLYLSIILDMPLDADKQKKSKKQQP